MTLSLEAFIVSPEKLKIWELSPHILSGTGHRPHKTNNEYDLKGPYSTFLRKKIQVCFELLQPRKIISGMALGFDQLLALEALERNIKVIAAIPCDGQESKWPQKSKDRYYSILSNSLVTEHHVSPGPYHVSKMQVRNIWMCNNSDAVIAAWDGSGGGTENCLSYASFKNMLIYRINPSEAV